jgi:hypothetical protein
MKQIYPHGHSIMTQNGWYELPATKVKKVNNAAKWLWFFIAVILLTGACILSGLSIW